MRKRVVAGAGALASFLSVLLHGALCALPAHAADLADLEARIAELETTTVRGGNRRVQVNIYGQVNRALLLWDDGFDRGTFVVDNHTSSSRIGLVGHHGVYKNFNTGEILSIHPQTKDEVQWGTLVDAIRVHSMVRIPTCAAEIRVRRRSFPPRLGKDLS